MKVSAVLALLFPHFPVLGTLVSYEMKTTRLIPTYLPTRVLVLGRVNRSFFNDENFRESTPKRERQTLPKVVT